METGRHGLTRELKLRDLVCVLNAFGALVYWRGAARSSKLGAVSEAAVSREKNL